MIRITEKENCCGCSSCTQCCPVGAISMIPDEQGFLYPKVDNEKCFNCGKCEKICPIINPIPEKEFEQRAYLLQHKNQQILNESSSGGAFTAIAEQVIQHNGVVFGAAYDCNFIVHHTYVDNLGDLCIFRNSKYVQSDVENSYKKVKAFLNEKREVCFSGTPCQIEGLLNFLGDKPKNLVLVDIVCHAVPSPYVWKAYLQILKKRGVKDIKNLRFRDKDKYGYLYSQFSVETTSKKTYQGIETNEMLRAFFSEICNRPSCYSCKFKKIYRRSDMTIWDCFDVDEFTMSKIFEQNKGISRVLVHSKDGQKMIDHCGQTCIIEEITPENAMHFDAKELTESVSKDPRYIDFWNDFYCDGMEAIETYFSKSLKNDIESIVRRASVKVGVYQMLRKSYKKLLGNRKR